MSLEEHHEGRGKEYKNDEEFFCCAILFRYLCVYISLERIEKKVIEIFNKRSLFVFLGSVSLHVCLNLFKGFFMAEIKRYNFLIKIFLKINICKIESLLTKIICLKLNFCNKIVVLYQKIFSQKCLSCKVRKFSTMKYIQFHTKTSHFLLIHIHTFHLPFTYVLCITLSCVFLSDVI